MAWHALQSRSFDFVYLSSLASLSCLVSHKDYFYLCLLLVTHGRGGPRTFPPAVVRKQPQLSADSGQYRCFWRLSHNHRVTLGIGGTAGTHFESGAPQGLRCFCVSSGQATGR